MQLLDTSRSPVPPRLVAPWRCNIYSPRRSPARRGFFIRGRGARCAKEPETGVRRWEPPTAQIENSLIAWCGPEISSALRCCLIGSSRVMPSSCRCYLNGYLWRKRQRVLWSSDSENNGGRTSLDPLIRSLRRQICNRALGETILTPCRHGAYTARDRR